MGRLVAFGLDLFSSCAPLITANGPRTDPQRSGVSEGTNRLLCSFALLLAAAAPAGAATITFDSLATPGSDYAVVGPTYTEAGFVFTATSTFFSPRTGNQDYTGTGTLVSTTPSNAGTVTASGGAAFDFTGITIWELNRGLNTPITVQFTGTFLGGGTITQSVTTNGPFDGDVFTFSGFTNLVALHWGATNSFTHQIDNVILNSTPAAVPEPASMILLGTGLLGVAARRWRQTRR